MMQMTDASFTMAKKSSLVSGNQPSEKLLSLTHLHSQIRIYIFNLKAEKKMTRRQKPEETKEEKRISVQILKAYNDIVLLICSVYF